jgi:hypothetical protein
MKDDLRDMASGAEPGRRPALVREYLQARILQILQDHGAFMAWAFQGGTALRFLYALPRFSEDLDFAARQAARPSRFDAILEALRPGLEAQAYAVSVKVMGKVPVRSAFVRFPGLPFDLGLSPHRSAALSIKVEVDENPPAGAGTETTVVRRHGMLNLLHYDRPTLLAGKLHAVLMRPFTKGRDLYDLLWYLSDPSWPAPNVEFLGNALAQTDWKGPSVTMSNWRKITAGRLGTLNWARAVEDVRPFLDRPADADVLTLENLTVLLRR